MSGRLTGTYVVDFFGVGTDVRFGSCGAPVNRSVVPSEPQFPARIGGPSGGPGRSQRHHHETGRVDWAKLHLGHLEGLQVSAGVFS